MVHRATAMLTVLLVVSVCWFDPTEAVSGSSIAQRALNHVGETTWMKSTCYYALLCNQNKCNIFVADILEEAGATVPHRHWYWSPIGAGEWGNPSSSYLTNDDCWQNRNSAQTGYVIGDGVHVGIVTGNQITTSAPQYEAVKSNDWGFRTDGSHGTVTYWEYTC